jgi:hypothetical protein
MAQSATMTVTSTSATVHKTPSVSGPVIGRVPAGHVIEVQRELGSWVAVPWPSGPGNSGYIHLSKGKVRSADATDPSYVSAAIAATAAAATPRALPTAAPAGDVQHHAGTRRDRTR